MRNDILYRHFALREDAMDEDESIRLIASTDDAVSFGGYREVLMHNAANIDMDAARALLVNHDPDQIAGTITEKKADGHILDLRATLHKDARLASGVRVGDAIKSGSLRGVSIGYNYNKADASFDEATRTITVRKWRLLEATLTPIPADPRAMVRSLPEWAANPPELISPTAATPAAPHKERQMPVPDDKKPDPQGQETAPVINAADISEKSRAAAIKEAREIAQLSDEHGLRAADYVGMRKDEATSKMLVDLAEKRKTDIRSPVVSITVDQADKARDAAVDATLYRAGFKDDAHKANPLRGLGMLEVVRRYAAMVGLPALEMSKNDLAYFAVGKLDQCSARVRAAANVTTGMFPNFVMLNAVTKGVVSGYEASGRSINYQSIVSTQNVPDFKSFYIGGLSAGNLSQTVENAAFPELSKSEGVYNDTLKMWGGTMSLSFQALINDDTAQFDRNLRQAGLLAQKTINKRVFQKLLMGTSADEATSTWTSNTVSGCSPVWSTADTLAAARAKIGVGIVSLMNKVGLDGNPLGTIPSFYIAGPTAGQYLNALLQGASGQTVANAIGGLLPQLVVSPWMEASSLTGYSTSTFYLLADPNEVTGLVVSFLQGMNSPQVMQYDPGAVAAINWKIFQPFEADLAYLTVGGTATIAAAQQCTT